MGVPELLHHLRGAGLVLTLTPGGGLHVAPRSALTDDHRAAIRAERDALVLALNDEALRPPRPRRSGNPLMTPDQGDECHAGGWEDAEIAAFVQRHARLLALGFTDGDADDLAERLTLRDREQDDRRVCSECMHYRPGRCSNHKAAALLSPEVGRDLAALLQRCAGFQSREVPR